MYRARPRLPPVEPGAQGHRVRALHGRLRLVPRGQRLGHRGEVQAVRLRVPPAQHAVERHQERSLQVVIKDLSLYVCHVIQYANSENKQTSDGTLP